MLGITVGVATVLAMMAVGAGAQQSIEQQVRAAGLNQLTINAGNWKLKSEDRGGVVAHQGDAEDTMRLPVDELMPELPNLGDPFAGDPLADDVVPILHPEDDPMEKHDHPLAWQRLGDLEAGLGAAATLSFADAEAIREARRRAVRGLRRPRQRARALFLGGRSAGSRACTAPTCSCSTSSAPGRCASGRFFTERRAGRPGDGAGARVGRGREAVRRGRRTRSGRTSRSGTRASRSSAW